MCYLWRLMNHILILSLCMLAMLGCNKKDSNDVEAFTEFFIQNNFEETVTVDIYPSEKAYATNKNLIYTATIESGAKQKVPGSILKAGNTYYVDWYNKDYTTTNWWKHSKEDTAKETIIFNTGKKDTYLVDIDLKYINKGYRKYILKDNLAETRWVNNANGINAHFIFKKDFTVKVQISTYARVKGYATGNTKGNSFDINGGDGVIKGNLHGESMSMRYYDIYYGPDPLNLFMIRQ